MENKNLQKDAFLKKVPNMRDAIFAMPENELKTAMETEGYFNYDTAEMAYHRAAELSVFVSVTLGQTVADKSFSELSHELFQKIYDDCDDEKESAEINAKLDNDPKRIENFRFSTKMKAFSASWRYRLASNAIDELYPQAAAYIDELNALSRVLKLEPFADIDTSDREQVCNFANDYRIAARTNKNPDYSPSDEDILTIKNEFVMAFNILGLSSYVDEYIDKISKAQTKTQS